MAALSVGGNCRRWRNDPPAIGIVLAGNRAADPLGVYRVRWSVLVMDIGYCLDCKELNYALRSANGVFERANMSNNHVGHNQYIFEAPEKYTPPIRNVLTKIQANAQISDNEIVLFKLAIALGDLDKFCAGISESVCLRDSSIDTKPLEVRTEPVRWWFEIKDDATNAMAKGEK